MAGFNPKDYLDRNDGPPLFDPKSYVVEQGVSQGGPSTGADQAALEHFGNAVAMGYLPHLQALAEKILPNSSSAVDEKLKSQGFTIEQPEESYVDSRDANIARLAKEEKEHPLASAAGTVGGVISGGAALGEVAGGAKAVTAAGRIAKSAKTGATIAALANPGDTEGKVDPLQLGERIDNAKVGAVTGGAFQGAMEAAPHVLNGIKFAGKKVASLASGLTDDQISQYSKRTDEINSLIKSAGGDMTEAADQVRQETQDAIRSKRGQFSSQIGKALEAAPKDPVVDIQPIKDRLNAAVERLNPNLQSEAVDQIKNIIGKIETEGAQNEGKVSIQQLNQVTDFLQGRAKSAYMNGGQIFQNPKEAAQAAKGAAAISRKMLNSLSPEIAEANNKLALLHNLEDRLNPNLIAPGKSDSALFAAGAGSNSRNAKMLKSLSDVSGYDALERAKDLSAAKVFSNPSLLPADSTGKAVARQLVLGGIGSTVAGPVGWLAAAGASPAAVKVAINASNAFKNTPSLVSFAKNNPALFQRVVQSIAIPTKNESAPEMIPLDHETLGIFKTNPALIDSIASPSARRSIMRQVNRVPNGGEIAWVQQGLKNLQIEDADTANRLLSDPKAKKLLIQASDLSTNSRALQNIRTQIKEGWGKK